MEKNLEGDPKIIIGDDIEDILLGWELMLGDEATTVTTPEEFINALQNTDFDVVVTDLNYTRGGKEGYEILRAIKDRNCRKILCTSEAADADVIEAAAKLGAEVRDKSEIITTAEELLADIRKQTTEKVHEIVDD
jgi:CheY-like chemotaxis protein